MTNASFADLFARARTSPVYKAERLALDFTKSLETLMDAKGMTRAQLAERAGVSKAYVTKLFRGDGNYTLETMVRFADAVGADLHQRVCDTDHQMRWFEVVPGSGATRAPVRSQPSTDILPMDPTDDDVTAAA